MKTVNEYRSTRQLRITGTILDYLAAVRQFVQDEKEHLVTVCFAEENKDGGSINLYTVRVIAPNCRVYDRLVRAFTHRKCEVVESVLIG